MQDILSMVNMIVAAGVPNLPPQHSVDWIGPVGGASGITALGLMGWILQHMLRVMIPSLIETFKKETSEARAVFEATLGSQQGQFAAEFKQQREDFRAELKQQRDEFREILREIADMRKGNHQ